MSNLHTLQFSIFLYTFASSPYTIKSKTTKLTQKLQKVCDVIEGVPKYTKR